MFLQDPTFAVRILVKSPLPVHDPQSLAVVPTTDQRHPGNLPLSHLHFKDLRAQNAVFSDMASIALNQVNDSHGQEAERILIPIVTANDFSRLAAAALPASDIPARRATRIDPLIACGRTR